MYDWCQAREMIAQASSNHQSDTWDSDERHLCEIIAQAEKWGIEPKKPAPISLSNLRSILRQARDAMKQQDRARFQELIDLASCLGNRELRLELGSAKLDDIPVKRLPEGQKYAYRISVTQKQLDDLRRSTRTQYRFVLDADSPPPEIKN